MSNRYFNSEAYPFFVGDTKPTYIFTIYNTLNQPADFSSFPNIIVKARFREKGSSTSLAVITCETVSLAAGKFKITTWPSEVAAAEEGIHELEIEIDYKGDGTEIQTVFSLIKFKVYEEFGDES